MTALQLYRDDGPLAGALARRLASRRRQGERAHPLAWLVPPCLRALEYGSLIAVTALADPDALPMCFALLVVLAFHHYDTVYRLRHQGPAPPSWLRAAGGGWEGRILGACLLALAGVLEPGLFIAALGLGLLYALESAASWSRFSGAERPDPLADQGDVVE